MVSLDPAVPAALSTLSIRLRAARDLSSKTPSESQLGPSEARLSAPRGSGRGGGVHWALGAGGDRAPVCALARATRTGRRLHGRQTVIRAAEKYYHGGERSPTRVGPVMLRCPYPGVRKGNPTCEALGTMSLSPPAWKAEEG